MPQATGLLSLVFFDGGVQRYELVEGRHSLGRDSTNAIVLNEVTASREHAVIEGGPTPRIMDLGSLNGTRLNGARLPAREWLPLAEGAVIEIGTLSLFVRGHAEGALRAPRLPAIPDLFEAREAPTTVKRHNGAAPHASGDDVVLVDPRSRELYARAERVAQSTLSILITGETGVGKERLAHHVHRSSARRERPFVVVNCAAIPEQLIEVELFGHERGAFTGAVRAGDGYVAAAHGGTLFLDEVGELPLAMQAKLLRVLEAGEVTRIGARRPTRVDVRFVAATNRDLRSSVRQGSFREDLYHRLHGVSLKIPPLRERRDDIPKLVELFAHRQARQAGRVPVPRFSSEAMVALRNHGWPGNVRQLKNVVDRCVLLSSGPSIGVDELGLDLDAGSEPTMVAAPPAHAEADARSSALRPGTSDVPSGGERGGATPRPSKARASREADQGGDDVHEAVHVRGVGHEPARAPSDGERCPQVPAHHRGDRLDLGDARAVPRQGAEELGARRGALVEAEDGVRQP